MIYSYINIVVLSYINIKYVLHLLTSVGCTRERNYLYAKCTQYLYNQSGQRLAPSHTTSAVRTLGCITFSPTPFSVNQFCGQHSVPYVKPIHLTPHCNNMPYYGLKIIYTITDSTGLPRDSVTLSVSFGRPHVTQ
jgi:hypothetical protein